MIYIFGNDFLHHEYFPNIPDFFKINSLIYILLQNPGYSVIELPGFLFR